MNLKERIRFAKQVLFELGAPESPNNLLILLTWMAGESTPDTPKQAKFNPTSTTKLVGRTDTDPGDDYEYTDRAGRVEASLAEGMSFHNKLDPGVGVMDYANWDQGVAMTVATLRDGDFRPIKDILLGGSTTLEDFNKDPAVRAALSIWSSGGYTAGLEADPVAHGLIEALEADAREVATAAEVAAPRPNDAAAPIETLPDGAVGPVVVSGPGVPDLTPGPEFNEVQPGFVIRVTDAQERIEGGLQGRMYTPTTFYYVQPVHASATGEGPSVFWQITGMEEAQIYGIVEGNENYGDTREWGRAQWNTMVAQVFTDGVGTKWQMWRPSTATVDAHGLGPDGFRFDTSVGDEAPQLLTVEQFVQDLVVTLGLMGSAAWGDEGVQAVIARAISEPDLLGQEYLFDLFNDTEFAQNRSGSKETWDKARGNLIAGKWTGTRGDLVNTLYNGPDGGLIQLWQSYNSSTDQPSLQMRGDLYDNAVAIAQGTMTWWAAVAHIQDYARLADGDNLWKQHVREVDRQTGQYAVDLDNKAWEIEQFEQQWGMHSPGAEGGMRLGVIDMARGVLSNSESMADVKQSIMDSANELYPNKPSLVPTYLWAEPWVNAYNGLMPTSAGSPQSPGSMYNALVNQALRDNTGIEDFEQTLRGTDDWKNSNKGVAGYQAMFGVLADAFGFAGQRGYGR